MARSDANRSRTLDVPIEVGRQSFRFRLHARPLQLGPATRVAYHWMDSSLFRRFASDASFEQFRAVVGHWAAAMRQAGAADELDQQVHYVCAVCYPLVADSRGMQGAYKDAYLAPGRTTRDDAELPDDQRARIRTVVRGRDTGAVRAAFDEILGRFAPPTAVMPLLQEAFRRWVGTGVVRLRESGNDGLESFLQEVDGWIARYRKKGGNAWVRHFVNLFAYECKVSFFTCYANAWVDLIPWLREHRRLDEVSERFLRFWHNQNPNAGGPAGRDVFGGQVLALHPLSGFFMKDPALLAVAGRFFGTDAYDRVMSRGEGATTPEYWDLVGAILTAAQKYRNALDRQGRERGRPGDVPLRDGDGSAADGDSDPVSLLRDFVADRKPQCGRCRSEMRLASFDPAAQLADVFTVHLACRACRATEPLPVTRDELLRWLRPAE